jgi:hypothetical protein
LTGRSKVGVSDEDVIEGKGDVFLLQPYAAGGIPLRISVD